MSLEDRKFFICMIKLKKKNYALDLKKNKLKNKNSISFSQGVNNIK